MSGILAFRGLSEVPSWVSAGGGNEAGAGAGFRRSSRYACIYCRNRSSVGVAEGAVPAGAGAAGLCGAEVDAAGAEPGAGAPKSVTKAVKPVDSVDLLELLGADPMDVAGADLLATPWMAAPRTGDRRREVAILSDDGERNSLPSKQASWTVGEAFRIVKVDQLPLVDLLRKRGGCSAWMER